MKVLRLKFENFRNYESQSLDFTDGVNVIYGDNAQGKTNILEGIYFFAMGKSNRARLDAEVIRHGCEVAKIQMQFADSQRENLAEAEIYRDKRKKIILNEIPLKRNSELVQRFKAVYFGPEYLGLVKEGPSVRRKSVDILISQIKPAYMSALTEMKRIVESKNALLRMEHPNTTMLDIMDEKLAKVSAGIIMHRALYISRADAYAKAVQKEISSGAEDLEIKYKSCVGDVTGMDAEAVATAVAGRLSESRQREMRLGEAVVGPHREDLGFFINGMDAKVYASQGQQKTIVMAYKLAEVQLLTAETGETPVLLLDDIMSEFDKKRRDYILEHIKDMQIFITCTDLEGMTVPDSALKIEVEKGKAII